MRGLAFVELWRPYLATVCRPRVLDFRQREQQNSALCPFERRSRRLAEQHNPLAFVVGSDCCDRDTLKLRTDVLMPGEFCLSPGC